MKVKGVNPFEQHLEQIVLVVVSVVFLAVLALQFLWEPNRVKVGGKDVPPGEAFSAARDTAKSLKTKIELSNPPELEEARAQIDKMKLDLVNEFRQRLNAPVSPAGSMFSLGRPPRIEIVDINGSTTTITGKTPIADVKIPAPSSVVAVANRQTIDPMEPESIPELKPLLPPEQPMDKASVTVEARVDGAALKAALLNDPKDGKFRPIPAQWYRDTTALFRVKLERQTRAADGQWSEPVEVKPAPGRYDISDAIKKLQSPTDMEDLVNQARASADDILRPAFYHTIAGPAWAAPSAVMAAAVAPVENIDKLLSTKKQREADVERIQKQIDKERGGANPVKTPPDGRSPGGGGGGKGSGGGGGAQPPRPAPTQDKKQDALSRLEDQLKKAQDAVQQIVDQLQHLGYDENGKRLKAAAPVNTADAGKPLFDNPDIQVWGHDLTVEPGKTYRYRVQTAINNPAFGRGTALVDEQKDMGKNPLVYSQPSEWSMPVTVPDDQYYFVTGASEADVVGAAHATVEMYRFFYGYYRKGLSTVEPGDQVMVSKLALPAGDLLPIYDLTTKPADAPGQAQPPAPSPGRDPGRGPKGYQEPGLPGKGKTGTGSSPQQGEKPALPENAKPWTKTLSAMVDVVLLDVARSPSSADGGRPLAIVRVSDGSIETCDPDDHHTSDLYKRVAQSAKEGETQGVEAPSAKAPTGPTGPTKAPTGPVKGPKAPPPPGGGGGGGSG